MNWWNQDSSGFPQAGQGCSRPSKITVETNVLMGPQQSRLEKTKKNGGTMNAIPKQVETPENNQPGIFRSMGRTDALLLILLLLWVGFVYSPVLTFGFVNYDDPIFVTENTLVSGGLSLKGLIRAFSETDYFYCPITWLSLMLDYELGQGHPKIFHATNVIIHLLNTILVFGLARWITGSSWFAVLISGLFALHPTTAESVAWISERKGLLAAFFMLSGILAYLKWTTAKSKRAWMACLLFYGMALLSKPSAVCFPLILLLVDLWPINRLGIRNADSLSQFTRKLYRHGWPLIQEKAAFIALTFVFVALTVAGELKAGAIAFGNGYQFGQVIPRIGTSYYMHAGNVFWPMNLSAYYPASERYHLTPAALYAAALVAGVAIGIKTKNPQLLFGLALFNIGLLPMAGIVPVGSHLIADRYLHIPLIGVAFAIKGLMRVPILTFRIMGFTATLGIFLFLFRTPGQIMTWRDSVTLFTQVTNAVKGEHIVPLNNLAWALATERPYRDQPESVLAGVEYAKRACALVQYKDPLILDTLYVCYVAAGDAGGAVQTLHRILQVARETRDYQLLEQTIEAKRILYEQTTNTFQHH
jgi:protein O-mannosyl-transferase